MEKAPKGNLPDTGVGQEWEENMSSIFVVTPEEEKYGTRSQVVLLMDQDKKVVGVYFMEFGN